MCCCLPSCFRCATAHCASTAPPRIVPPPPVVPPLHHHTSCLNCTTALRAATTTLPTVMPPPHSCRHCTAGCRAAAVMPPSLRCWVSCHCSCAVAITLLPVAPRGAATCCVCNALAGVKARHWRLGSQSGVGRVTGDWQRRGGRAPYSAVLLCTGTTRMTQDGRLSLPLSNMITQEDLHEGEGKSVMKP